MRKIFPLKPSVCASSNPLMPNSITEAAQKDKGQAKVKAPGRGKDESKMVDFSRKDNLKGLKENSLGAHLRREQLSPVRRPLPSGEENLPCVVRDGRPKVSSKRAVGEEKSSRSSTSGSSMFFSKYSSQRSLNSSCEVNNSSQGGSIQSASVAVASDCQIEDKYKKHLNKNTKIFGTKRSIDIPRKLLEGINKAEVPVSARSNSFRVAKVSQRTFELCSLKDVGFGMNNNNHESALGEMQEIAREEVEPITSADQSPLAREEVEPITCADQSPLLIPSEEAPMEVVNCARLVRSQSVTSFTDSYDCDSHLTRKTSPKKSRLSVMKGSLSSTDDSVAGNISLRCQSYRTVAEKINYKSHRPTANSLDMQKLFEMQNIPEDKDRVGSVTEGSVSASEFLNPHSSWTEEELYSIKLFDDSPIGRQAPSSEDSQTGRSERSLVNSRSRREDRNRFRRWLEGYQQYEDIDEMERRASAAEEQAQLLSKEMEMLKPYGIGPTQKGGPRKADINVDLQEKVKMVCEEKRNLFLKVASEIRSRLSDRFAASEALKLMKGEIESHVKMAEDEKNSLQLRLEKELDRRSKEWGPKLEKIGLEEKRLKDRVRDLAEQNVALQREVLYLNTKENDLKSQMREYELYADGLKAKLKKVQNEIALSRQSLAESYKQTKEAEDDRQSIQRSYEMKERENSALLKSIIRLQRLCKDQERTITGLCKGLNDEINDIAQEKSHYITKLQKELLRVNGEEQAVSKDLMNCTHKNMCLPEGQRSKKGNGYGLIKVDQELWARLDELQSQALSLLDENSMVCAKLLEMTKSSVHHNDGCEANEEEDEPGRLSIEQKRSAMVEHEMNVQILKRKVDMLRKSIHMVKGILKEKTLITCNQILREDMEKTHMQQTELLSSEAKEQFSELQQELKAETILSRLLREKLCSKEVEVEQLEEDVVKLIQTQELLKTEIGQLQNLLGTATRKARDLEFQLGDKDERIGCLEADLKVHLKELAVLRGELINVLEERDGMQRQAERLGWENMRMNSEIDALQRKVEKLDEDVMLKDGQISILRASIDEFEYSENP